MSGFAPPPPPPSACSIRGHASFFSVVSSAESGGNSLARLGGDADWELLALSGDRESGRAKVRWSSGTPGMTIEGWIDAVNLEFRAKHDLALVPGHVWISAQASLNVRVDGAHALVSPYQTAFANVRATVACSDLQIADGEIDPVVDAAAYWTSSQKTLAFYSAPKGQLLGTFAYGNSFDAEPYAALEEKNGFLHLVHEGGVRFDAWVKTIEMKPWLGERPQLPFVCGMGNLEFADSKPIRTVAEDTEVFLEPSPTSTRVGFVTRGAQVRVSASKKSFVAIEGEHGAWGPADGKKLWIRGAALGK